MTRSTFAGIAAFAMIGAAAPAFAADDQPQLKLDQRTGEYCTPGVSSTGSILQQRVCHTVADWQRLGLTIQAR